MTGDCESRVDLGANQVPGENEMDGLESYCENLTVELGVWKDKISDVVSRIDRLSSGDKARIGDQVNDLHIFTGELENRLERLRHECSTEWRPEQIEMKAKLTEKYIY
jgi:hypothetical protein